MTLRDIEQFMMRVPAAQFQLIAHLVKWILNDEATEINRAWMMLDGKEYTDGLAMSYMMQIHDLLMLRPINALLAATITFEDGTTARMWVEVMNKIATLSFTGDTT
jgi:hypothetical protein